jgi:hypothetical protein
MVAVSDKAKAALVVLVLVALVPLWNFVGNDAAKAFHTKPVSKPSEPLKAGEMQRFHMPSHLGPKKAPVVITVYLNSRNSCHAESIDIVKQYVAEYPGQVSAVFKDLGNKKNLAEASDRKIGCEMGILINDHLALHVPGKGLITFQGPLNMGHGWTRDDVRAAIESQILSKTGKPAKRVIAPKSASTAFQGAGTTTALPSTK